SLRSSNMLDEVVAIGYGTVKKSDLTGSVSSVASDKLQKTPSASLANALQGQAAGVTVNSLTGRPGASAEVRIRGVGTVNGASPIYVVDGVIVDDISFVSPADIESTEILKDASAAAIYGSRGANGVVLVTTKSGRKADRANISFDMYVGWENRHKKLDVMGAKDFADTYVAINGNTASKNYYAKNGFNKWLETYQGVKASPYYPTVFNPETNPGGFDYSAVDTDWQDEVFRTGMIQNYHLSIDGGSDQFTYSASGSWFKQEGTLIGSDYSRFTARLNTSYKATPWMKIGENISFMAGVAKNAFEAGDNSAQPEAGILAAAFAMAPWDPTHYPAGSVNRNGEDLSGRIAASSNKKEVVNPFSMVEYSHPKRNNSRFVGNAYIELTPIKYLTWKTTFGFDYNLQTDKSFSDSYLISAFDKRDKNFLSSSMAKTYNWNVDNILTYTRTIGDHSFSAMAGQTVEEYNYYSIGNSGANILNAVERNWFLSQVTENFGRPSDSVGRNRRFSWLGRLYYSYKDRY
ncbi:MAG: SusC/RagA family TonB-linked outer membrane protein, partial [Muribaculaceae bacterium]|nr:SusC/RagA family TonB-linked outer membrane protein [Muribaculaceae bacterium]